MLRPGFQPRLTKRAPITLVMSKLARSVDAVDLPVTVELESGCAQASAAVESAATIEQTIAAGAMGCKLEDGLRSEDSLRANRNQMERNRSAPRAAGAPCIAFLNNARADGRPQPR